MRASNGQLESDNSNEFVYSPDIFDLDNDGLTDSEEVMVFGTDPQSSDTDNDGVIDGSEALYWGDNWNEDDDSDGLINLLDNDSDNDGFSDGQEIQAGSDPSDGSDFPDAADGVYSNAATLTVTTQPSGSSDDYSENFSTYSGGSDPAGWLDTAANNSMAEDDALFETMNVDGGMVFGTRSTRTNIHSHYTAGTFDAAEGVVYTGRMRLSDSRGGIGLTFLSDYNDSDSYYRLRSYSGKAFHLAPHPHGTTLAGTTGTSVVPAANTWYRFKIQVADTGGRTEIKSKVWANGSAEPGAWQIDAWDAGSSRLTAGRIGVWSMSSGSKYWDDLKVQTFASASQQSMAESTSAPGAAATSQSLTILSHPADVSVDEGDAATFTVVASGSSSLGYQWQRRDGSTWVDIAGAIGSSYTISAAVFPNDDGASFRCFVSETAGSGDTTPPTVPGNVRANAVSSSRIAIAWNASTDNQTVLGYRIFRNGTLIGGSPTTSYEDTGLAPSTQYSYTVSALDNSENESPESDPVSARTFDSQGQDTTPPTVPGNVRADATSSTRINLSWDASTDDVGVQEYRIFRNGYNVATSQTTSYEDTGLAPSTQYSYTVSALDNSGNESPESDPVCATTDDPQDTSPPSILSVTATKSTVKITFNEALDPQSAETSNNYVISGSVFVMNASLESGGKSVVLQTTTHTEGTYELTVFGVEELDGNPMPQTRREYEYSPPPVAGTGPKLYIGSISGVSSTRWETVNLPQSYASMVVVASPNYDAGTLPGVVRIRNVRSDSFEVSMGVAAPAGTIDDCTVHYLVIEEGVYTKQQHGVKMEAVVFNSTVTDGNKNWSGEASSYGNTYTQPVVVGQVMSHNDDDFSVFWSHGTSRSKPPNGTTLNVGKHVGEDPDKSRSNEVIGYVVMEAGSGGNASGGFFAGVCGDTIRGIGNAPPYLCKIPGLNNASVAIVSQTGMDVGDGGWPVLYGSQPIAANSGLNLAIDEDQMKNSERRHGNEQVAYIVFY